MPRHSRQRSKTDVYHIMLRGVNRMDIFNEDSDRIMFLHYLKECVKKKHYEIWGFCLMNNHVHLLVKSDEPGIYMHKLELKYAMWFNDKYERCGHLFQNRYRSEVIETEGYLCRCLRYILQNPVKAGICQSIPEYAWSSYKVYFSLQDSFVSAGFIRLFFAGRSDFEAYMEEIAEEKGILEDRVGDRELRQLWLDKLSGHIVTTLSKNEQRDLVREMLKIPGIGIRQLSRITGIDKGIISRLRK